METKQAGAALFCYHDVVPRGFALTLEHTKDKIRLVK